MRSRLWTIILLIVWVGQMARPAPGKPPEPEYIIWVPVQELRALVHYQARCTPPWLLPCRRPRLRPRRRRRPPPPQQPPQEEEEEQLEQPPEGWPDSIHTLLDPAACVALFEQVRWAAGKSCPRCGSRAIQPLERRTEAGLHYYRCLTCQAAGRYSLFHAATGTLFEHSHLSPTQWMVALLSFAQGESALEMADQLATSRRIGERWRRLFQVVLYQQRPQEPLTGEVEADEIYHISGYKGHPSGLTPPRPPRLRRLKRRGRGSWEKDKPPIVVLVKRGGSIRLRVLTNLQKAQLRPWLLAQVERGSQVYTDDYEIYDFLKQAGYRHRCVNHSAGEYARGDVHCNTAEAIWSLLRPYLRTFRGVSKVYLPLYVAAFEFRHNHRHLTTWQQAGVLLQRVFQADGAEIRKVVRENTIVEYCQLPT